MELRYGMNPHQKARTVSGRSTEPVKIVSGRPSAINLLDAMPRRLRQPGFAVEDRWQDERSKQGLG